MVSHHDLCQAVLLSNGDRLGVLLTCRSVQRLLKKASRSNKSHRAGYPPYDLLDVNNMRLWGGSAPTDMLLLGAELIQHRRVMAAAASGM